MRMHTLHRVVLLAAVAFSLSSAPSALAQDGTWTTLGPDGTPGLLRGHANVFDRDQQRYVIFAGGSGTEPKPWDLMNDVWILDVSGTPTWSLMPPGSIVPGGRLDAQYGYDAARNRLLIFGGYGRHYPTTPFEYLNDVWELSLEGTPHWTELFPAGTPPAGRLAGAAVYDPMRQRFIGFGGTQGLPVDTWSLNLQGNANWQNVPTTGARPNGGYGMTSVYDASRDRMLIFGGSTSDDYYGATNDVWELRLRGNPTWTLIHTTGVRPAARRHGAAIFDPLRNRMVIYGGAIAVPGSEQFFGDTWALDFDSDPPAWTELHPGGTMPSVRDNLPAAYDPLNDRMIIYGGWSGSSFLSDTQFLSWGGTSSEALLTGSGSATPTSAHVEWDVNAATGTYAAVYRKQSGGVWTALAQVEVNGAGNLVFDDATVTEGQDYDYMMVVGSQRGETFGGTTSIQVPGTTDAETFASDFALHRVVPNPVAHHMAVSLSLPNSDPATLELLDAAGRRWLGHEVGGLGAGMHRVELAPGRVPAGLYFLRLQQRGRVAMTRVVMLGVR